MLPKEQRVEFYQRQIAECERLSQAAASPVLRERYSTEAVAWARLVRREAKRSSDQGIFKPVAPRLKPH